VVEEQKARRSRQATAAARAAANSFAAVAREFFIDHKTKKWQQRPRHWRADARLLGLNYPRDCDPANTEPQVIPGSLAATWADKPVTDIDSHDIHTVIDEARKLGLPGLPRRNNGISEARGRKMHACLSNLFRWAQQQRKVTVNPCVGVWHPGAPPARERALTEAESRVLLPGSSVTQNYLQQLSQARNFQDVVRVQSDFMQSLMKAAGEQTSSLAEAYTKTAADVAKKPLSGMS
jgi:hypothetical protein